jgi:hypothetical protein
VWKEVGEPLNDRLVESTVKFGGGNVMIWGCMFWEGIGYATRIEGKMAAELYCSILYDELQHPLIIITNPTPTSLSSKTTTPSTGANGLKSGLQIMGTLL